MSGSSSAPTIIVFSQSEQVGTLIFTEPGRCSFTYDEVWAARRFSISPALPLDGLIEPAAVTRFLRNLFPEGEAFDLLLESKSLSKRNLYAILQTIGKDTAGALSFFNTAYQPEKTQLRPITADELMGRLDTGSARELVTWDGKYRLSVAGVQNKLNVYIDDQNQLMLAGGAFSSTHILKFSSQQYKHVVVNELFCMRLANELTKKLGLKVAKVAYKKLGVHDILIVERFDRKRTPKNVKKRHMIDGCQALDLPLESKYENNFGTGRDVKHIRDGVSFKKLFSFAETCAVPASVIQQLLDWALFNLIIGNSDAHGKNVSFFVNKNGISITPFYDLISVVFEATDNSNLDTSLAMAFGDNFEIDNISAFDLLSFADESNIAFSFLKKRLELMATEILNKVELLQFIDCELADEQLVIIDSLKRLITRRASVLLSQLKGFDKVAKVAF